MYTDRVSHLTGATNKRFKNRWEWIIVTEDEHTVDGGLLDTEAQARSACAAALSIWRGRESIAYWLNSFNGHEDGQVLRMGLGWSEFGKYGMSITQWDAMITAAKTCKHAGELQSTIEDWEDLRSRQLSHQKPGFEVHGESGSSAPGSSK